MNYDSSWRADGEPALDHAGVVAGKLLPGSNRIEFSYFPRTLAWSVPLSLLTLALCFWRRRYAPLVRAWVLGFGRFWPRQRPSGAESRAEGRP